RVDQAVAGLQRRVHGLGGDLRGRLEDAEAEGWHLDAVVQHEGRSPVPHVACLSERAESAVYPSTTISRRPAPPLTTLGHPGSARPARFTWRRHPRRSPAASTPSRNPHLRARQLRQPPRPPRRGRPRPRQRIPPPRRTDAHAESRSRRRSRPPPRCRPARRARWRHALSVPRAPAPPNPPEPRRARWG